jgi:hypothetical protein
MMDIMIEYSLQGGLLSHWPTLADRIQKEKVWAVARNRLETALCEQETPSKRHPDMVRILTRDGGVICTLTVRDLVSPAA